MLLLIDVQRGFLPNSAETLVDDRQEHAHAHEHHHENEQTECQWAQKWGRTAQLLGIEFHEGHLEQHLRRVQQGRARQQLTHEQQIEERDERPEHHREHRHERRQISGRVLKSVHEEHQSPIETTKANELDRGKETREAQKTVEQIVHVRSHLQVDGGIAMGLGEQITDAIRLAITPDIDAHIRPRTGDDAHVDVRPELTEIAELQLDQRLHFDDHHSNDEQQIQNTDDEVRDRLESEE